MIDCPYTKELLGWGKMAWRELSIEGDAWVLSDPGGELREYLRLSENGYAVTHAERGGAESFRMSAYAVIDIERYLTDILGWDIRSIKRLPDIMPSPVPLQPGDIAPGYVMEKVGQNRVALLNRQGDVRVIMQGDTNIEAFSTVAFSWIADASLADLRASYLDPDGLPLFPGCLFGPGTVGSLGGENGVGCQS